MIEEVRSLVERKLEDLKTARSMVRAERVALKQAKLNLESCLEAQQLIQGLAASIQAKVHDHIATVVTKCLQTVFPDDQLQFKIKFNQKRGKTEAEMTFVDRDGNEVDPTTESGGGVLDVTAFALRVAALIMMQPRPRRFLFLDEPFRGISEDNRPMIRQLLETLSNELNLQIVLITHDRELVAGEVIEIK